MIADENQQILVRIERHFFRSGSARSRRRWTALNGSSGGLASSILRCRSSRGGGLFYRKIAPALKRQSVGGVEDRFHSF